jgi:hypothetical protein
MAFFTKCDSCDKTAPESGASPPMDYGTIRADGWVALKLDVFRRVQACHLVNGLGMPLPGETLEGQTLEPDGTVFYQARRSHLDLCPSCAERVIAALGPAASKVAREVTPPRVVQGAGRIPIPAHAHRHPSVPFKDE